MPLNPREIEMFWRRAFAEHEAAENRPASHEKTDLLVLDSERTQYTGGGVDPLMPKPAKGTLHRPFTPLCNVEGLAADEDEQSRRGFIYEIITQLTRYGANYVREALRNMGYTLAESHSFAKEARMALAQEHLQTDVEEHRAISIARMDRIFQQADDALDPKVALAAQKHRDRITGVTADDGAGGVGDLAELARLVAHRESAPPAIINVIDAEMADGPAPPRMQILSPEQIAEIEAERAAQSKAPKA